MSAPHRSWWARWWRAVFGAPAPPAPPADPGLERPARGRAVADDDADAAARPVHTRRRYTAPPPDDPRLEADLGAVLHALAGGPLSRARLRAGVEAGEWDADRLDAVVDHGIATGVLLTDDAGTVRARYAD